MKHQLPAWMRSLATARRVARSFDQTIFDDDEDDTHFDAAIAKYLSLAKSIFKRGSVELYRALSLDFDGRSVLLNVDCLGGSWAWNRSGTDVYASGAADGALTVVITARVSAKNIAWSEGFENYLRHPGESEVALLRNRPVLLTRIDDKRLAPSIKANTGNAGEYWSDECAGGKRLAIPVRTAPTRRVGDFFARSNPSGAGGARGKYGYHTTDERNLMSIQRSGLVPSSPEPDEQAPSVWFTDSLAGAAEFRRGGGTPRLLRFPLTAAGEYWPGGPYGWFDTVTGIPPKDIEILDGKKWLRLVAPVNSLSARTASFGEIWDMLVDANPQFASMGGVENWLSQWKRWKLVSRRENQFEPDYLSSDRKDWRAIVHRYAAMDPKTMPPIVAAYSPDDRSIKKLVVVDGRHRALASFETGRPVLAWIPEKR